MSKARAWGAMILGAGMLGGCAPMPPQSQDDPIAFRLNQLESRMEKLEQSQQGARTLDVVSGQQQIQEDLRQLKGSLEQQAFQLQNQEQRINQLMTELQQRIPALGGGTPAPAAEMPMQDVPASDGTTPAPSPAPVPVASPPPVVGEQASYDVAFNLLKEGRYPQAADAFTRFLQQYPSSRLAPNAQYWLAESQYVARNYDVALAEFRKVVAQYPGNPKLPDALLKIGYIHSEKQQWTEAKTALERVIQEYPSSGSADLARQRLNRLQREGHIPG
ncbi:MAG TPA: tol-pal system protein YbgF [Candidatus Macondimonas sp.]|nr:tol-pal system protein YbgF [Candidatus Macondimonas sp.]